MPIQRGLQCLSKGAYDGQRSPAAIGYHYSLLIIHYSFSIPLREFRVILEAGTAFLQECLTAFLRLVRHIVKHGSVSGQLLYTGLSAPL